MSRRSPRFLFLGLALSALATTARAQELDLPHERYQLPNGLDVILHEDHSDPVVAVYVYYHVGSGREELGRSGFAHLFEHMMFQGSQNVGDDQHFKYVQEAGGTLNGTTNTDRTNYYEILPSNQLELALWLESDRMGFLLPAMTQEKLDNQREVVKNERRQSYENRPYGLVRETTARTLYPHDHPYSWTTIGSMDDLSAASLEDVSAFFRRWYGPNNATLAIGGAIDVEQTKQLVERYFGSIPRGPEVAMPTPRPIALEGSRRVVLEDKVKLPQLTITWPTVDHNHADEAALDLLASVLSANRSAILDKALTVDEQLASQISAYHYAAELAGTFNIQVRPQPGVSLDRLEQEIDRLLRELVANGVEEERIERLRNRYEAQLIRGLETVSARTSNLGTGTMYHDDPTYVKKSLAARLAVTAADVDRVLKAYLVDRPSVYCSVVPEGELSLAASGRDAAQVAMESGLDRGAKPGSAARPSFTPPAVWHTTLANGIEVVGSAYSELPLAQLSLSVPAGRLNETRQTLGLASLTAAMLEEGTASMTGIELQDAFDALGATLFVGSNDDEITFRVSTLDKHLPKVIALLEEIVLEPRFAEEDFERIRRERLTDLEVRSDSIRAVAGDAWQALNYGADTVAGSPSAGTPDTVAALRVDQVRDFWQAQADPRGARLMFVGGRGPEELAELCSSMTTRWTREGASAREASFAVIEPSFPERTIIFLVDKPGAAQSEIRIGHPGVSSLDPVAYDLEILNHPLGGSFSSRINLNLREDKGYTYGARSRFGGGLRPAPFVASAGVRTDVTGPSVAEFMKELQSITEGLSEEELAFTRDAMSQAMSRQFESTRALVGFLQGISFLGYADDYPKQRQQRIDTIARDELNQLAKDYVHPDRMRILVVGDKEVILEQLAELGYGEVIELDVHGRPISG